MARQLAIEGVEICFIVALTKVVREFFQPIHQVRKTVVSQRP
jgi:hypothetical protein